MIVVRRGHGNAAFVAIVVAVFGLVTYSAVTVSGWVWPLSIAVLTLAYFLGPRSWRSWLLLALPSKVTDPQRWVDASDAIGDLAELFEEFLTSEGVPVDGRTDVSLPRFENPEAADQLLVDVLNQIAAPAVHARAPATLPAAMEPTCALIAVGEFLTQRAPARRAAIKRVSYAGHGQGNPFVSALLALRQGQADADPGAERGTLGWLIGTPVPIPEGPHPTEMDLVRHSLRRGEWPPPYSLLVTRSVDQAGVANAEPQRLAHQNEAVGSRLRVLVRDVEFDTLRRYLETQRVIGYLISFDGTGGSLADVIDHFKDKGHEVDGQPKYRFVKWIFNSRVGVVPRGWSFDRFAAEFQQDFKPYFDEACQHSDFCNAEIRLQRFRLSQYRTIVAMTPRADDYLRGILGKSFTTDECAALIGYDDEAWGKTTINLLDLLAELSLTDAAAGLGLTTNERRVLSRQDVSIRAQILTTAGFRTRQDMARRWSTDSESAVSAAAQVAQLVQDSSPRSFTPDLASQIGANYVTAMSEVGKALMLAR